MAAKQEVRHLAIIMDGNGRWAKQRHLPRIAGHKQGMENIRRIARACDDCGIKVLTLYAFSTENWARPKPEVNYLMSLPVTFFNHYMPELQRRQVRVKVMGYPNRLPAATEKAVKAAVADTADNQGMVLNFAFNYGSRAEIVTACREIAQAAARGQIRPSEIDEQMVAQHLMTADLGKLAEPDLLIRTSGEERLSNFLLWQLAYTEFYFTDRYWPDFDEDDLQAALAAFAKRHRRFGKV